LGYAQNWWIKSFDYKGETIKMYSAIGWAGQKLMIIPELDMVIAFNGANYSSKNHNFKILKKYILSSMQ